MHAMARWWDGVELWVVGLPFLVQVAVVLAVVAPLGALAAQGLDRVIGWGARLSSRPHSDPARSATGDR